MSESLLADELVGDEIAELASIEDFLGYFGVHYQSDIVMRQRIPLLRMFQALLAESEQALTYRAYQRALVKAYCAIIKGQRLPAHESHCGGCSGCASGSEEVACE